MIQISFVCHGNICRSPMAEFIMKHILRQEGLQDRCRVGSFAATGDDVGSDMYPPAKKVLLENRIPFERRKARLFTRKDYKKSTYVIAMDRENLEDLDRLTGGDPDHKVSLLLSWAGKKGEISDPYFTGDFEKTFKEIDAGCQGIAKHLFKVPEGGLRP